MNPELAGVTFGEVTNSVTTEGQWVATAPFARAWSQAHWAPPALLAGVVILFVALEVEFYGFVLMLQLATRLEGIAWYQIGAANLVAAALMGRYLWVTHPGLTQRLNESLSGRP